MILLGTLWFSASVEHCWFAYILEFYSFVAPFTPVLTSYVFLIQEGYVWVLLHGGPSRSFSDSDIIVMGDDLNLLKVCILLIVVVEVDKPIVNKQTFTSRNYK